MESIPIDDRILSEMQMLGRGACAVVYKYNNDTAIKILNDKGKEMYDAADFSKIVGIKNSTCVFPQQLATINGEFSGYTMDYVDGVMLDKCIEKIDFQALMEAIRKVEIDLKEVSNEQIGIEDLNHGGLMWDERNNSIKIIDTDFFRKIDEITPEQCYARNMEHFNTIMQMELGIINGYENDLLTYLQSDKEYMQLDKEAILASFKGESVSLTKYIERALEIFKRDFGVVPNNLSEMKQILKERDNSTVEQIVASENNTKIISLDDYRKDKQQPTEENRQEPVSEEIGVKQKIANFFANKPLLRKIPFIDRFVTKEQRLLPEVTAKEESKEKTEHSKFVDEISKSGQYRYSFLGQPVKNIVMETVKQKYGEPHSMADKNKIEQMRKKMDGKSMEDDL